MATTKTTRKAQTTIQQAVVYRCTSKETGEVFYTCRSDSDASAWYEQHFNEKSGRWECQCPATQPCKHCRAISEICNARKEFHQEAATPAASTPAVVAQAEQVAAKAERTAPAPTADRRELAPLNGRNQGFSILRR